MDPLDTDYCDEESHPYSSLIFLDCNLYWNLHFCLYIPRDSSELQTYSHSLKHFNRRSLPLNLAHLLFLSPTKEHL